MLKSGPGAVGLLVFLFSSIYFISFCRYGLNLWDEGALYYGAIRYMNGQKVMTDFMGYPEGRYIIVEAVYRLFGMEMINVRYAFAFLTALLPFLTYHIARRFISGGFLVAAVLLSVSAPAVYYQRFYGFVFLLNAFALLKFLESKSNYPWLIAGLISVYLFKVEVFFILLPAYSFVLWKRFEDGKNEFWITVVSGAALLTMIAVKYGSYLFQRMSVEVGIWGNSFPSLFEGYQGREFGLFAFLENLLFYLPIFTSAFLVYLGIVSYRKNTRMSERYLLLGYLQFAALGVVIGRAGFDNLIRCLPLFFIAAPIVANILVDRIKPANGRAFALSGIVVVFFLYMADLNLANGFYAGSIGAVQSNETRMQKGRAAGIYAPKNDVAIVNALVDWIDTETRPGDKIFSVPLNPLIYYLADRDNPSGYDWLLPGTLKDKSEERELVKALDEDKPNLIVLVDLAIDNNEERKLNVYAPLFVNWIADNYSYAGRVAYYQIWRKHI
ncbi:MAG: hypothetical protein OEY64_09890 [Nitrospinota bacterium]|nr:hypothetical protein [Nitrospinota bacterium]